MTILEIAVLIPAIGTDVGTGQLDETDSTLDQSASEQAFASKGARRLIFMIETVKLVDLFRLSREIREFRNRGLHPIGQLSLGNRPFHRFRLPCGFKPEVIEAGEKFQFSFLALLPFADANVGQRLFSRKNDGTLMTRGQKGVGETVETSRRNQAPIENDKTGKILVQTSQAVTDPGTHTRSSR